MCAIFLNRLVVMCGEAKSEKKQYPEEKIKAVAAVQLQLMKEIDEAAKEATKIVYQGGQMKEIKLANDPCTRFEKHVELLDQALVDTHMIDCSSEVIRCPQSAAVNHGDFPEIEEKLAMAKEPRYRNIVKTLGKRTYIDPALNHIIYICKNGDGTLAYFKSDSVASAKSMSCQYLDEEDLKVPEGEEVPKVK